MKTNLFIILLLTSSSTFSQNCGWSEPFDLSQNSEHWADNPKICTDSKNNIHVIYSYMIADTIPGQLIYRKYDGNNWSDPIDIAKESPNSEYPCITIDHNDRVYAFWHNNFSKIFYRYLEDTTWSSVIQPFSNEYDFYLRKAISDKHNNIHCVGQSKKDIEDQFRYRPVYFKFDYKNNIGVLKKF